MESNNIHSNENNPMNYLSKEEEKVDSKSSNKIVVDSSSKSSEIKKRRSFENDMIEDLSNNLNDSKNYIRKQSNNDHNKGEEYRNSNYYFSGSSSGRGQNIFDNNAERLKSKFYKNGETYELSEEEGFFNKEEDTKKFDSSNSMAYNIVSNILNKSFENIENNSNVKTPIPSKFNQLNKVDMSQFINQNVISPNLEVNQFNPNNTMNQNQQDLINNFSNLKIDNSEIYMKKFQQEKNELDTSNTNSYKNESFKDVELKYGIQNYTNTNDLKNEDFNQNLKLNSQIDNNYTYIPNNYYAPYNPYIQQPVVIQQPLLVNLQNYDYNTQHQYHGYNPMQLQTNNLNQNQHQNIIDQNTIDSIILECKEQKGCRKYQRLLDENQSYSAFIYGSIKTRISELILDQFGNYLVQKLVELLSKKDLYEIICNIEQKIIFISKNAFGTRVLQKIISISNNNEINGKIINQISKYDCLDLVLDNNASHVISSLIISVPIKELSFLFKIFIDNTEVITKNKNGCCVIQKMLEKGDSILKRKLVENIVNSLETLILDPFANYVLQCCMAIGYEDLNKRVVTYCSNDFTLYAINKYSSNVIDKALSHLKIEDRNNYINLAMKDLDFLASLALDLYANHLFQKILLHASPENKKKIFEIIKKNVKKLKSTQHGEKLLNRIKTSYNIVFDDDNNSFIEDNSNNEFEGLSKNTFKNTTYQPKNNSNLQNLNSQVMNQSSTMIPTTKFSNPYFPSTFKGNENVGVYNNLGGNIPQQSYLYPYQNLNQFGQLNTMNQVYPYNQFINSSPYNQTINYGTNQIDGSQFQNMYYQNNPNLNDQQMYYEMLRNSQYQIPNSDYMNLGLIHNQNQLQMQNQYQMQNVEIESKEKKKKVKKVKKTTKKQS